MGTYPIKLLRDEQGTPFVPLVSSDSVQTLEGEKLTKLLDDKLSPEDLVAGQYIELNTEEGKTTISVDLPASVNTINNLTTETSGQGALDAYQGKVLKDSIPNLVDSLDSTDANKALSARQGKILNEKTVPEGGKVGQVLKKSSNNDHELEWGDAADPNAIVGDGSIMSIVELSYAEYKALEAAGELEEDTEYHIPEMGGDPGSGTGGSGLSEADVQYMIDTSLQDIESVPAGGSAGQVLKKSSDEDHALEWGDAADPNAIVGDGSIMKIIELTYNEYLELEKNNALAEDTEYHISDWNENERTYLTTQEIEEIVYDKTANHTTENQVNSMIEASIINNLTTNNTTKSLSAAQGKVLNDKITQKRKVMRLTRSKEIQWYGTTTPARMPYDIINYNSSGGVLTKSRDGSIRIGAGVQQVRVSGQIPVDISSPDSLLYMFVYLYLNDTCVFKTLRPNIRWDVLGIYDIVLDVKEGDVIDLYISTNNTKQILLCAGDDYSSFGPGPLGYLQVEILA